MPINKYNFNYYFKIIYKFRNDKDYLRLDSINKVLKKDSRIWLRKNIKNRIFFLIKYKNQNSGIFNFNKQRPTFSQVISKKFRKKKIGKISAILLLKKLKKLKFYHLETYASKNNIASYKIHKSIAYKSELINNKKKIFKFFINTRKY